MSRERNSLANSSVEIVNDQLTTSRKIPTTSIQQNATTKSNRIPKSSTQHEIFRREIQCPRRVFTNVVINPYHLKQYFYTPKVNEYELDEYIYKDDKRLLSIIQRARMPPNKLYNFPQTTAQEIGWFSSHRLLAIDQIDRRFHKSIPGGDFTDYGNRLVKYQALLKNKNTNIPKSQVLN